MVSSYAHSYDGTHLKSRKPRSPSRPSSRKSELERMRRRKWRWRWKRQNHRSETLNRNPRQSRLLHKLNDFDERSSSKRPRSARSTSMVCAACCTFCHAIGQRMYSNPVRNLQSDNHFTQTLIIPIYYADHSVNPPRRFLHPLISIHRMVPPKHHHRTKPPKTPLGLPFTIAPDWDGDGVGEKGDAGYFVKRSLRSRYTSNVCVKRMTPDPAGG
jgi:hypothetical protein